MVNAIRLFGVTAHDHQVQLMDGTELLTYRDLSAIVAPTEYVAVSPTGEVIEQHRQIVNRAYAHAPVLPAPVGTVFRSPETVLRWLELHYVTLSEALAFVDDRAVARVHVRSADTDTDRTAGSDLAATAADAFRALRRQAVSALPLKSEHLTGIVLSSAFLVEKELWNDFVAALEEQRSINDGIRLELSGPWPPFDFVHMQFGG